jgi:hypothetical protein
MATLAPAADRIKKSPLEGLSFLQIAMVVIFGIFATSFAQPQVLGRLPLTNVLKNELHCSPTQLASFFFLCSAAWYFKPFAGILTDAFPLMKTRRRHYLLASMTLAGLAWAALFAVPRQYEPLLIVCLVINAFMVVGSTVVGAILVEAGQAMEATGRLTSLRIMIQSFCTLTQGPLGGILASGAFAIAIGANVFFVLTIVPIAYVMLRERPEAVANVEALSNAKEQLGHLFKSRTLWWAILFLGLFYFAPGFSTPMLYRQQNEFNFSIQSIGYLQGIGGAAALVTALAYAAVCRKLTLRSLIVIGVLANAAGNFCYLLYSKNFAWDGLIEAQNGVFFTICEISMLDLAARSTPKGCEGLGYALMLSIRNFALYGADIFGSSLVDNKVEFWKLVALNSGTTLLVLVLLPFLPKAMLVVKDGVKLGDAPA